MRGQRKVELCFKIDLAAHMSHYHKSESVCSNKRVLKMIATAHWSSRITAADLESVCDLPSSACLDPYRWYRLSSNWTDAFLISLIGFKKRILFIVLSLSPQIAVYPLFLVIMNQCCSSRQKNGVKFSNSSDVLSFLFGDWSGLFSHEPKVTLFVSERWTDLNKVRERSFKNNQGAEAGSFQIWTRTWTYVTLPRPDNHQHWGCPVLWDILGYHPTSFHTHTHTHTNSPWFLNRLASFLFYYIISMPHNHTTVNLSKRISLFDLFRQCYQLVRFVYLRSSQHWFQSPFKVRVLFFFCFLKTKIIGPITVIFCRLPSLVWLWRNFVSKSADSSVIICRQYSHDLLLHNLLIDVNIFFIKSLWKKVGLLVNEHR